MLDYASLPSFNTFNGKMFWCGVCSLLAASFAVSAAATYFNREKYISNQPV